MGQKLGPGIGTGTGTGCACLGCAWVVVSSVVSGPAECARPSWKTIGGGHVVLQGKRKIVGVDDMI